MLPRVGSPRMARREETRGNGGVVATSSSGTMKTNGLTAIADRLGTRDGIAEMHGYFEQHRTRLSLTLDFFDLWKLTGKRILEIGPFFGYTPFLFRQQGNEVAVLEGTDPVVAPLLELYKAEGIRY